MNVYYYKINNAILEVKCSNKDNEKTESKYLFDDFVEYWTKTSGEPVDTKKISAGHIQKFLIEAKAKSIA